MAISVRLQVWEEVQYSINPVCKDYSVKNEFWIFFGKKLDFFSYHSMTFSWSNQAHTYPQTHIFCPKNGPKRPNNGPRIAQNGLQNGKN